MKLIVKFLVVLAISPFVQGLADGFNAPSRPGGLPTYTPSNAPDFGETTFQNWISDQAKAGVKAVGVAPGIYNMGYSNSQLYPITFWEISDLAIWMDGVTLIVQDHKHAGITIGSSKNIAIHGLTTRYAKPNHSQAKITAITQNGGGYYVDMTICDGYEGKYFLLQDNNQPTYVTVYNSDTMQPYGQKYQYEISPSSTYIIENNQNRIRMVLSAVFVDGQMKVGDYLAIRGWYTQFYYVYNSEAIQFYDVTINSCGNGVFMIGGNGRHHFERFKITNGPDVNGVRPLISATADGLHGIGCKYGITVINSLFEGLQDDGINFHGIFYKVSDISELSQGKLTLSLYAQQGITDGFPPVAGDRLRFYDSVYNTMNGLDYVTVTNVENPTDTVNPRLSISTSGSFSLDSIKNGWIVSDIDRHWDGFYIADNTFRNHRARALLIKGKNGIIDRNIIDTISIGSIWLYPELNYFVESDWSLNVTISNNYIRKSSFHWPYGCGAISILADNNGQNIPRAGGHVGIYLYNNVMYDNTYDNIMIWSTSEVIITNNIIVNINDKSALWLDSDDKVSISGNCVIGTNGGGLLTNFTNVSPSGQESGIKYCSIPIPTFPVSQWDGGNGIDKGPNAPTNPSGPVPDPSSSTIVSNKQGLLKTGEKLTDSTGRYEIVMQLDGNLVIYYSGTTNAVWASGSYGELDRDYVLVVQGDGNMVIYAQKPSLVAVWSTSTSGKGVGPWFATLNTNGAFVLYDSNYTPLWYSNSIVGSPNPFNNVTGPNQFNNVTVGIDPFAVSSGYKLYLGTIIVVMSTLFI